MCVLIIHSEYEGAMHIICKIVSIISIERIYTWKNGLDQTCHFLRYIWFYKSSKYESWLSFLQYFYWNMDNFSFHHSNSTKNHQTFGKADLLDTSWLVFFKITLETHVNELCKRNAIYVSVCICHDFFFIFYFFLWLWNWKKQNFIHWKKQNYTVSLKVTAIKSVGNLMNRNLPKEMTSLSVTSLSPHKFISRTRHMQCESGH